MAALKFAIAGIALRQSREVGGEELRRLETLADRIDAYLNDPEDR